MAGGKDEDNHKQLLATREDPEVCPSNICSSPASHSGNRSTAPHGVNNTTIAPTARLSDDPSQITPAQVTPSNNNQPGPAIANLPTTALAIVPGLLTLVATNNQNDTVTVTATNNRTGATATRTIAGANHASRTVRQNHPRLRVGEETIEDHPTDPNKLIVRFRVRIPYDIGDGYFEQVDEMPVEDKTAKLIGETQYYFQPDPEKAKVPPRRRANRENQGKPDVFTQQPDGSWTRPGSEGQPDQVWRPRVIFRRYAKGTNRYEEPYMSVARLKNVNPNDKKWVYAYNKWIDQFRRRRDCNYIKVVAKDHWTVAERRSLMNAINGFVREFGLHNFGFGPDVSMDVRDHKKIADAVNAVNNKERHVDAVRGQISSSHQHKNKAIDDLLKRANAIRDQLANGQKFSKQELFLREAIPQSLWPTGPPQTAASSTEQRLGKKRSRNKGRYDDLVATFDEESENENQAVPEELRDEMAYTSDSEEEGEEDAVQAMHFLQDQAAKKRRCSASAEELRDMTQEVNCTMQEEEDSSDDLPPTTIGIDPDSNTDDTTEDEIDKDQDRPPIPQQSAAGKRRRMA